ncbi:uncharacterized protein LOC110857220 [Folsomia candida]|uniref:Uncharacterized protein n=1 Tax=Folsomia candida TaxID=158441 RepID=A0A226DK37_FOLCA|nr:uncharacterized protein LOC110857220 [Folsomia candida]OXA45037.1 hypothetical protein Fcan01_20339 [Folsomia candida]
MPKPSRKYDHPQEYHRHEGGDSGKLFHSTGKWGVILILFSAVATSIAIFTPYWLQNDYEPTFSKMGLWIRCAGAEDYYRTNFYKFDLTGECRWILVPKEYPLIFLGIQIFYSICWILLMLTTVRMMSPIFKAKCCPGQNGSGLIPLKTIGIMLLVSAALGALTLLLFAVFVENWRGRDNYLSWSFGVAIMGVLSGIPGAILLLIESRKQIVPHPQDRAESYIY